MWAAGAWIVDVAALWTALAACGAPVAADVLLVGYVVATVLNSAPEVTPGWIGLFEATAPTGPPRVRGRRSRPRPVLPRAQAMSRRRAPTMPADVSAPATAVSHSNGTQVRSATGSDGTWVNGDRFSTHWSSWSTGPSWPISR